MTDLNRRLSKLSPAQRALLERRLAGRNLDLGKIAERAETRQEGGTLTATLSDATPGTPAGLEAPPPIPRRPAGGDPPLSVDQERIYFIHNMIPGSPFYNIYSADRFRGSVDVGLLNRALSEVVRRHENLRTRFVDRDGQPVQLVEPAYDVHVPVIDLRALPRGVVRRAADRQVTLCLKTAFVLDRLPLCRTILVRLEDDEYIWPVVFHHIVIDWVSSFIFQRELVDLYEAYARGERPLLAELPIQYADYAVWQREQLTSAVLAPQLEFWKRHLADAPHATELPADRPRPAVQSGAGGRRAMAFSAAGSDGLRRLAQKEGVTLFMAFLSLFKALLLRLSGQQKLIVGSPMAARNHVDLEGLIGYFLYQTVFYTDLSGDPGFSETLRRVRSSTLDAFANKDTPFGTLVELVNPERDMSRMPLTQLVFLFLDPGTFHRPQLPGIEYLPYFFDGESSKFDMTFALWDRPEVGGLMEYNSDLFDDSTIDRFASNLRFLSDAALADPERPLSELSMLSPGERQQMLAEWNDTAVPEDAGRRHGPGTLHGLVEAQAESAPERVAVVFEETCVTYGELDARAGCIAEGLAARDNSPVGVFLERSEHLMPALLGVMKAGGAYVPLDPTYPESRLRMILEDAAPDVVLTDGALAARLPETAAELRLVEQAGRPQHHSDRQARRSHHDLPEALAYVIFTSGSTGRPKGVQIPHRAVVNLMTSMARRPGFGPGDTMVALATFSFDMSIPEIWLPLTVGAKMVLGTRQDARDAPRLGELLTSSQATAVQATPTAWQMLLDDGWRRPEILRMFCGAEALPRPLADRLLRTGGELWNFYGPTETTVWSAVRRLFDNVGPVEIGSPIANTELYVLDRGARPVPIGAVGELLIGGTGMSRGYRGRPARSAASFVPHPLTRRAGERLYRTGDLARFRGDGAFEFLGRVDHQVKVRGYRIELGEIEAQLATHPAVAAAVAVVRTAASGNDKRLVAYVVLHDGIATPGVDELRAHAGERLPYYMVPSTVVTLEALPLNPNGKVDRKALPAPEWRASTAYVPPRTPAEVLIAEVFAELLDGPERVGADDPFFELGGHSLLAIRVLSRLRETFQAELTLPDFFRRPTVAGLARRIEELKSAGTQVLRPALVRRRHGEPDARQGLPLSFAQTRLWFLDRLQPGNPFYNIPAAVDLRGRANVTALERALGEIVRRHEVLRTTFMVRGAEPVQLVGAFSGFELSRIDLAALPDRSRGAEVRRRLHAEARRPFDLERGALFRVFLLRLGHEHHVLFLNQHHIVSDGWSIGVLVRELRRHYVRFTGPEPGRAALPELEVQYADYAAWQRDWLRGDVLDDMIAYWRRRLAGAPRLELHPDRTRPPVQSFRGAKLYLDLPPAVLERLGAACRQSGVTLFMTLLAAMKALLARSTGMTDVVVGSPVANRTSSTVEGLIGFFVNTLVMRTDLAGNRSQDPTFAELAARVRDTALAAFDHQDVPFEQLVEALQPERDLARNPFFQVMFNLMNAPVDEVTSADLELAPVELESGTALFDLSLSLTEAGGGLTGWWEYATDLFDRTTVLRMSRRWRHLLAGAAAHPQRRLSELPLLSRAETEHLARQWNDTSDASDAGGTVHGVFEAQARRRPAATAVACGERRRTYEELDSAAARLAGRLRQHGVDAETRVGVALERSPEMVAALLAVLKTGATYVPLDPSYPGERLAFMLEDSGARVLLTQKSLQGQLPDVSARVVCVDDVSEAPAEAGMGRGSGAGAAYLIYTSGSTGRPKGVQVPHGGVVSFLRTMARTPGLTADDNLAAVTTLSFDIAVLELFLPLSVGGRVTLVERDEAGDPKALARRLEASGATVMQATPATWQMLLDSGWENPGGIRVLCGGEALPEALARQLTALAPEVWNLYGPTETTIWSSVERITADLRGGRTALIGRPIANTRLHVMDRWFRPAPAGIPGELLIGGRGVTRGYQGRPARSAAAFVPDPCGTGAGQRLYRTGDLARLDAAGRLEFLGRIDHQVKVRGFRIELGEIEAALGLHPGVRRAAAAVRGGRIVAYLVAGEAEPVPGVGELRRRLAESLPPYMLPAAAVVLGELPLTPNGKVDRKALPDPGRPAVAPGLVEPRNAVEAAVAAIWCDVLGLDRVGVDQGFFELGGHSLLATQLTSRVFDTFQAEVPLVRFFNDPTVAGLAAAVDDLGEISEETRRRLARAQQIPRREPAEHYPLSFAQQRLWFLYELSPESPYYNMPRAIRLSGALDAGVLRAVMDEVVRRHESLRTHFSTHRGEAVQRITEDLAADLPLVDLAALAPGARRREAERLGKEVMRRPFALGRAPLLRLRLLRLRPDEHALLLSMHHIVSDGWSQMVIFREVGALYEAFSRGLPSPLPELEIRYADFAVWQRGWLTEEVLEEQLTYWRRRMAGAPDLLELPADRPRPPVMSLAGEHLRFTLPRALTRDLEKLGEEHGVLLYVTLLAAFQALLYRYTGRTDMVLGSPIANRHKAELEGLVGFFVNMLPMRTDLAGKPAFSELLARVQADRVGAYDHQDVPFERLVEALKPERHLSYTPLFQVMFNLLNFPVTPQELGSLVIDPWNLSTGTSKYDLSLYFFRGSGARLAGFFEYSTDLFDGTTMRRTAGHLRNLLVAVARRPDLTLDELPLLNGPERHEVLVERNAAPPWNPAPPRTIHGLFEARAGRTPAAHALEVAGDVLTFAELDRRANAAARRLRGLGVGPETLVGVALERSADMVVALLAVLKAGGAYVPVDPSYPEARRRLMLEDARPLVVLSDASLLSGQSSERVAPPELPGQLAYVIYTSGSTGRPKGVAVTHASVVNFLRAMSERPGLAAGDVLLSVTTLSFDIAGLELFLPLAVGAKVVLASRAETRDGHLLRERLLSSGATAMQATPATWELLAESGGPPPGLAVLCGGEALPRALAERLLAGGGRLWNLYGPTETTIWSAVRRVEGGSGPVPVGPPITATSFYVLDARGQPSPPGVPGELLIGGAGLARGYLQRAALTAGRFVPDAFAAVHSGRLYRTGDLVRHRPGGVLEFLGRIDTQVKVRGFRIELGEVETALERHAAVRRAVVVVERRPHGADRLAAYLTLVEKAAAAAPAELRSWLGERLPDYMLPGSLVVLDRFPLSPAGKVDRKRLAAAPHPPTAGAPRTDEAPDTPRTPLERALADSWCEILGVARVALHERFFDLGGNSIQAAIFINRLQKELGRILHVTALFRAQSIAELVAYLEKDYPEALERWHRGRGLAYGADASSGPPAKAAEPHVHRGGIDSSMIREMRRLAQLAARRATRGSAGFQSRAPHARAGTRSRRRRKNPPAVFILSPPRSGSTLLRVMLAGHPRLFSPPELELLAYDTLGARATDLGEGHAFAREGLLRAVMELKGCDADAARTEMERYEDDDLDVGSFYGLLRQWSGGRTLVDKTSTYALDPEALGRAEELFEAPLYVHLLRHPCATVRSYVDVRLDQLLRFDSPFTPRQEAELLWVIGHQNIGRFLRQVPERRRHQLRFEDLVARPEEVTQELCRFLGVDFVPDMLEPYEGRRMTDGLHAESRMHGDPSFHEHTAIDAAVAEKWRGGYALEDLAGETRGMMEVFGYPSEDEEPAALGDALIVPVPRGRRLPLSFSQHRQWFLDQLEPGSAAYNIPVALPFALRLDVVALEESFHEVVRRHEALRTRFDADAGEPRQVILPELHLPLPVMDLSRLPEDRRQEESRRVAELEAGTSFDLAAGPLLRTCLVRLGTEEHVLLVTLHHIVADGWSLGIFMGEASEIYDAFVSGRTARLPELPIQYADYAVWQRRWLDGEVLEGFLDYWHGELEDVPPVLELPVDRARPTLQSFRGARRVARFDAAAAAGIRELVRGTGGTLYMALLAGLEALLHRYSGQDDFCVGTYVANRHRPGIEGLIGFFVNTLVLRADLFGDPGFDALLERVRETTLGAYAHQDLPFEKLLEEVQPERDLSHTPLFQVMLVLHNMPGTETADGGEVRLAAAVDSQALLAGSTHANFDLTLWMWEEDDELLGHLEYNVDLFDSTTISRLLGHLRVLFADAVERPRARLSELRLLSPAERFHLLAEHNDSAAVEEGAETLVLPGFEARATEQGDAVAVVFEERRLSFRELNRQAERLAESLAELGVEREVPVAVWLERSVEMLVSVLGVWKAGGTYVPLDPKAPVERVAFVLGDTRAPVILTEESRTEDLPSDCVPVVVERDGSAGGACPTGARLAAAGSTDPDAAAYVIYTSGSTGTPKGVVVSHRSLANYTRHTVQSYGIGREDRILQFASLAFDASAEEIYPALTRGATLYLRTDEMMSTTSDFLERCRDWGISVLILTTAYWHELVGGPERDGGKIPEEIRLVAFGGEAALPERLAAWQRNVAGGTRIVNTYGPTESTVVATSRDLSSPLPLGEGPGVRAVPLGWPVRNVRVHLLDAGLRPVGLGVTGEMCLGGAGLARGYLYRPGLTAERFVPDPVGQAGSRLYRSGDLARRRQDGDLEFLGRNDHQVKVRGYRVELGEIEAALDEHAAVSEVIVRAHDGVPGGHGLVAWTVPAGEAVGAAELRRHLRERLPDYMVPAVFVTLEALPRGTAGKVDTAALPVPQSVGEGDYVAPRTPTEEIVAGVWSEVLARPRVGALDNFFELGGHSLLATRIMARLRDSFEAEIGLRPFFEAPTVAGHARLVEKATQAPVPPIRRVPRDRELPLSFSQERLWFLAQLEPDSTSYHVPRAYRLSGPVDIATLQTTYTELFRRHEVLRTSFPAVDGRPVQSIHPPRPFELRLVDLRRLGEDRYEAESGRIILDESRRLFDLERGPLLKAILLLLEESESAIVQTEHHLVHDGWAEGVLMGDLTAIYGAVALGRPSPLPELPVQYADFAVWQREWLRGEVLEGQLDYWREHLAGAPELLELPTDRPRPRVQGSRGGLVRRPIAGHLARGLRAVSQQHGTTLFMTMLSAFYALLQRYSGQDDVVVGTGIANRHRHETEGLLGMIINTLPLRVRMDPKASFEQLLGDVRDVCLSAYSHQDVPFNKLVETLKPARSLSHAPIFQVMFAFHDAPEPEATVGSDLTMTGIVTHNRSAKFDMVAILAPLAERHTHQDGAPYDERILGFFEYDSDLFEHATVEHMVGCFEVLLAGVAEDPSRCLAELPLISDDERVRLLESWNVTSTAYPRDAAVHELFARLAALHGGRPAVISGDSEMSYAELDARSDRAAERLRALGVGPETRVGLAFERSAELVVATLGILKADGLYVPLDPSLPPERLSWMARDCGLSAVVAGDGLLREPSDEGLRIVRLDDGQPSADASAPGVAGPLHGAYVLYTSGSTGRPKGIVVSHRSIARLVLDTDYVDLGPEDRVAFASNTAFDAATFEIWGALLNGAALVVIPRDVALDPRLFAAELRERQVSALFLTTALFNEVARHDSGAFSTLRYVLFGGEAVDPRWVRRVLVAAPPEHLLHVYGPTEGTTYTTWHRVEEVPDNARSVPIGQPLANTTVYVVDAEGRPVPAGVPGELLIGGDGLARGYLGRASLTAAGFVPNAFSHEDGERLYRTGDRVRRLPGSGAVEFLGRFDDQVKIRGFRIEPGEIAAVLGEHPAVREAMVAVRETVWVREDMPGARQLGACVVTEPAAEAPTPDELASFLGSRLPDYMVPSAWAFTDAVPLSPTGKVDRRAVADLAWDRSVKTQEFVAPSTPTERALADVWGRILNVKEVGATDDFFDLGGHSLLATRVISQVRETFGVEVAIRELFHHPTVAALARQVDEHRAVGPALEQPPLVPRPAGARPRLSFAQERLWFLDQLDPGSAAYNVALALRLAGELRPSALRASLEAVAHRHESLRTTLRDAGAGPVQEISPPSPWPLPEVDLTVLGQEKRAREVDRLRQADALWRFDLRRGPLARTTLVRCASDERVLLFNVHHIVSDGWSMGVLVREVGTLYCAAVTGGPARLPEIPVQYADFAHWQRRWLRGEVLDRQLGYWSERLASVPVLELPADRPRPARIDTSVARLRAALPDLTALARQEGATTFMVLAAAFAALLSRHAGQNDVALGTAVANRTRAQVEPLIGFFVNTLVLRLDLAAEPRFADLVRQAKRVTLEAYEHQDLPFEKLVEELAPERRLDTTPLFQVMLVLQNAPIDRLELPDLTLEGLPHSGSEAKFDLHLMLGEGTGPDGAAGLFGSLEYRSALFDAASMQRLLAQLGRLLQAAVEDPDRRLADLPLLDRAARWQLTGECNDTAAAYPSSSTLSELFDVQADRIPDAVALAAGATAVTYRGLRERSKHLASRLRELGVGADVAVGIAMPRSPEFVEAALGVLRAGGVYVPLDPSYPERRQTFMVEDAGVDVVLMRDDVGRVPPAIQAGRACLFVPQGRPRTAPGFNPGSTGRVRPASDRAEGAIRDRAGGTPAVPARVATADSAARAYVIYTSGSTGRPKGISVSHRSVARLVFETDYVDLRPEDRVALVSNMSFDAATFEIWGALLHGARLEVIPTRLSPFELVRTVRERRVNVLHVTSALFNEVARQVEGGFGGLRYLMFGGEAADPRWVRHVLETAPPERLLHFYGPTESTTFTTWHGIERLAPEARKVPIGRALTNTAVYVVDRRRRVVPLGIAGELVIGGDGLAWGYVRRPRLTAEAFQPDALSGRPGSRLYATGDRVRRRHDSTLEFLGRIDHQVKLRGFRVELGEVETVLARHAAVREAVVLARTVRPGEIGLVAYVVGSDEGTVCAAELRGSLGESLPEFMVPASYVTLDAFPMTPSGKLDRRALPDPRPLTRSSATSAAPRNALEEELAGIWADVLDSEEVGIDDDFFDLGGHSLLATRLISRIRRTFGVELALRRLFEKPTVRALAREVAAARGCHAVPSIEPVGRRAGELLPLSFSQERIWFLDRLEPGNPSLDMPTAMRLEGDLDSAALHHAFAQVIRRHEILRTSFGVADGRTFQVIDTEPSPCFFAVDLSCLGEEQRAAEARRLLAADACFRFDLGSGPLVHLLVVCLAAGEHLASLNLHHIVSDGWSMDILIRELATLYEARTAGRPAALEPLAVQYSDFSLWQRQWLEGGSLDGQTAYWRRQLGETTPPLELPMDRRRPAVQTYSGKRVSTVLPRQLRESLHGLGRQAGCTLFMTLLAVFKVLLHRLSGQREIVVGTPVAGRGLGETESLIGCFLNHLVLKTAIVDRDSETDAPSFAEVLARVREVALDAYSHQDVPFERLLEELHPERDLSRTPLFQVFFNMLKLPLETLDAGSLVLKPVARPEARSKFDITVYVQDSADEIALTWVYNADLFDEERMTEMLRQYEALLAAAVDDPGRSVDACSLLTPQAAARLPDPRTALDATWHGAVHELFRRQAAEHAARTAVVDPEESWTYGELDAASDAVARVLAAAGVTRGDRVVIYAHRSAALVVAVFGVLKAGAAFVILDPTYPPVRLVQTVELAAPRGFLEIAAAGAPPEALAEAVAALPDGCRLRLPGRPQEIEELLRSHQSAENLSVEVGPNDMAYVAFTSGSTGEPKGIVGRHGPLSHFLPWQSERFELAKSDRYSLLSGLAHDPLQRDVFTPLCLGATLCVPDPRKVFQPGYLARWLRDREVTVTHLTPAMGQLIAEPAPGGASGPVPALRYAFLVGDALTARDVCRLRELAPGVSCVNLYGTTETQRAVGYYVTSPEVSADSHAAEVLPLGRGMEDVQLLVISPSGGLAGPGELGEIWVRSPHLACGYLGDAALTHERFQLNPFGDDGDVSDRVYRTGDLGRYLPSGDVTFAGRVDHQVKVRGFRIELAEIEAALGRHGDVLEAVVEARVPASGDAVLVAWVVPRSGTDVDAAQLRGYLVERLPRYMVPAHFALLESVPLTPNGKVDRRALARLDLPSQGEGGNGYQRPEGELEETLATVWQEVLGIERVGVHDNFFDLGGHSLLLVRLHGRLTERLGEELPLMDLFSHPNVRALAEHVERRREGGRKTEAVAEARSRAQLQIAAQRRRRRGRPARK